MSVYNYGSRRARESRLSRMFDNKPFRVALWAICFFSAAFGLFTVWYVKIAYGWVLIAIAILIVMIMYWAKHELLHVPNGRTESYDDILSRGLLKMLPENPDPLKLAEIVCKSQSGGFLGLRYGITPMFMPILMNMCVKNSAATPMHSDLPKASSVMKAVRMIE